MKFRTTNVKLTEKDKLMLIKYLNVCTDLHGRGCDIMNLKKERSKLNLQ